MSVARIFCPDLRKLRLLNCTKFGQLILTIIIKIDATRCQILRLKCTKIVFGCRAPPQTLLGELTTLPQTHSRLGGDRRLGRLHSRAFGTRLGFAVGYRLYARGAASVCVYCVNCTKFGQLILRIIIKIDATRCQIFRPKCTKIVLNDDARLTSVCLTALPAP